MDGRRFRRRRVLIHLPLKMDPTLDDIGRRCRPGRRRRDWTVAIVFHSGKPPSAMNQLTQNVLANLSRLKKQEEVTRFVSKAFELHTGDYVTV
jgi:hypothetical protein